MEHGVFPAAPVNCFALQLNKPEHFMDKSLLVILSIAFSTAATAQAVSCNTAGSEKKLTGAAKTAFLKQCEADKTAKLLVVSKDRKPVLAPSNSFGHCEHSTSDL